MSERCIAIVSEPPWHTHTHSCAAKAKYTVGGYRVCGTHKRMAERWQAEGRLHLMVNHWWKERP